MKQRGLSIVNVRKRVNEIMTEVARLDIQAVKIHLLYIIKGTAMEKLYNSGQYQWLKKDAYIDILSEFIAYLPSHIVIQRLFSDPHGKELVAPIWCAKKQSLLNSFHQYLEKKDIWQGKYNEPKPKVYKNQSPAKK